jgi:GxxExxY protein
MLTEKIIGAAMEVHRHLGPGLLESTYEICLAKELERKGIVFERQKTYPIIYKGDVTDDVFRIDFLIENEIIVEIKSTEGLTPIHTAQVLTYLRLLKKRTGLLLNFNVPILIEGIRRVSL